ncbi:MAG: LamG-like jellyroll fold domain-containing protein [Myxococcota bacterium]
MNPRPFLRVVPLLLLVVAPGVARAAPLGVTELDALARHLDCRDACGAGPAQDYQVCVDACGVVDPAWEKDGVPGVTRTDQWLAALEVADAGRGVEICYRAGGTVVVPAALCPGALCQALPACSDAQCALDEPSRPAACLDPVCELRPARTAADCADADADGIPAWLEPAAGGNDGEANTFCQSNLDCGFSSTCAYDANLGASHCAPRACGTAGCTAFHLELVASDDQQVLIQLVYDYSPGPARVLDLLIDYDRTSLALAESRPLPNLTEYGKTLHVTHLSNGVLRLVVISTDSDDPIRAGPLVELVFQRVGPEGSRVGFVNDDETQVNAVAPLQGSEDTQEQLADDALWGAPVDVPARADDAGERVLLWYGFDTADAPLTLEQVPDAEELCGRVASCAQEQDPVARGRHVARLDTLQSGFISVSASVPGVARGAVVLDGHNNHLRLPVHALEPYDPTGQSFSFSTWFYTEGNSSDEAVTTPQVLFSHLAADERTHFGLLLEPGSDADHWTLSFFQGDLLALSSLQRTPVAVDFPVLTWHHVAFTLDGHTGVTALYWDGAAVASTTFPASPPAISCPGFQRGSDVVLHEEGAILGGRPPEAIVLGVREGPQYQLQRMDPEGLATATVISNPQASFEDPDVMPLIGKVAYVSNLSGAYEVWIADLDGGNAQQVTVGFGEATLGTGAHRPRWAPDGSALIFESNAFSVPFDHNVDKAVQLYFVGYDPIQGKVRIPLDAGGTAEQLDYNAHAQQRTLSAYQLTRGEENHGNVHWLRGAEGGTRGDIVFDVTDERYKGGTLHRMLIPQNIREASSSVIPGLGLASEELRLLGAKHVVRAGPQGGEWSYLLYAAWQVGYETSTQFQAEVVEAGSTATVTVRHVPNGYDANCWDLNHNHLPPARDGRDAAEDANGDGAWNTQDCHPVAVDDLFLAFDPTLFVPRVSAADSAAARQNTVLAPTGVDKDLRLGESFSATGAYVRVEITSPRNGLPIPAGVVARIKLDRRQPGAPTTPMEMRKRGATSRVLLQDLLSAGAPQAVSLGDVLDDVEAAAFSPDGTGLLLYGRSRARPVVVRTRSLTDASQGVRIRSDVKSVRGLSWTREQRYFPCNWVGGVMHPIQKTIMMGLRGALDELKLHAGVRDPDAILSESALGHERLQEEGRDGALDGQLQGCVLTSDCPAFHLCVAGACRMVECSPEDPYACAAEGGRCTLRPISVEQEQAGVDGYRWVCAADCEVDNQCFTQSCGAGPCRFCEVATAACVECRDSIQDYGAFTIRSIEGCPDRNSFQCAAGACETECYTFRDGQSIYRCDPALEFCQAGRCATLEWDWPDFAPASLLGLTETIYEELPDAVRTVAVGEQSTIRFKAYGKGDRAQPPEVLVEARAAGSNVALYGGNWFEVGRVTVHNRTRNEADANPYLLHVSHPITDVRLRLVHTPYQNLEAAASGLGARDKDFCVADAKVTAETGGEPLDQSACIHRPPGSIQHLGYAAEVPFDDVAADCAAHARPGCPNVLDPLRVYLVDGRPTVLVLEMRVDGTAVPVEANPVCSYEGTLDPVQPGGAPRKLFYGDIRQEKSPTAARFCQDNPTACAQATDLLDFSARSGGAYALLNCNYNDPGTGALARVDYLVPPYQQPFNAGAVRETGAGCMVELDAVRREQCYEFMGGQVTMDPLAAPLAVYQVLEFTQQRSFGHDRNFTPVELPRFPLTVAVSGYQGGGLQLRNRADVLTISGSGEVTATFANTLRLGERWHVEVERQPTGGSAPRYCVVDAQEARGAMRQGGATVHVSCGPAQRVGVQLSGLVADRAALRLRTNAYVAGANTRAGTVELDLWANGTSSFPVLLPVGATYLVEVRDQPRVPSQLCTVSNGSGAVLPDQAPLARVVCVETPPRLLGGRVDGLEGQGLILSSATTDELLTISAAGPYAFSRRIRPGLPYQVAIHQQPTNPAQRCEVEGATGVMPNQDHLAVRVACATLPTYAIKVNVGNLRGRDLVLSLNGSDTMAPSRDGVYAFTRRLLDGASYDVKVTSQPHTPLQDCTVISGTGTVNAADVQDVQVVCADHVENPVAFAVHVEVSGLLGDFMRLSLNNGTQRMDVTRNGRFTFNNPLSDNSNFVVEVAEQPSSPAQTCTVAAGSGRITGADVVAQVSCPSARLNVALGGGGSGQAVRGVLLNPAGAPVGEQLPDASWPSSGATLRVVEAGRTAEGNPPNAALATGSHRLYLWVNSDGSNNGGVPTFQPGDAAVVKTVSIPGTAPVTVNVSTSELAATIHEPVLIKAPPDIDAKASVVCYWTATTGGAVELPAVAPLGTSAVACSDELAPCFRYRTGAGAVAGSTNIHAPLLAGTYDLTCWYDQGGPGGAPDNIFNAGDRVGFTPGVNVDGPGVLTSQAVVTLNPP